LGRLERARKVKREEDKRGREKMKGRGKRGSRNTVIRERPESETQRRKKGGGLEGTEGGGSPKRIISDKKKQKSGGWKKLESL